MYDRRVPILRGPNSSMNTGLKITIIGYLATMFTIGVNELWHFWFVEEIFAVPNHWMFNMGRSEEHTSELQSRQYLVCRLLLEKKKKVRNDSPRCSARRARLARLIPE